MVNSPSTSLAQLLVWISVLTIQASMLTTLFPISPTTVSTILHSNPQMVVVVSLVKAMDSMDFNSWLPNCNNKEVLTMVILLITITAVTWVDNLVTKKEPSEKLLRWLPSGEIYKKSTDKSTKLRDYKKLLMNSTSLRRC